MQRFNLLNRASHYMILKCIYSIKFECKIREHSSQAISLKVQISFLKPQSNLAMYQSPECAKVQNLYRYPDIFIQLLLNTQSILPTLRKMFLSAYLVILMMPYILQSNRNCQVSFSFTVIQICLCRLKSLTLIEENDLLFFILLSHFSGKGRYNYSVCIYTMSS